MSALVHQSFDEGDVHRHADEFDSTRGLLAALSISIVLFWLPIFLIVAWLDAH